MKFFFSRYVYMSVKLTYNEIKGGDNLLFNIRLKQLRTEKKLTQDELAKKLNIGRTTVSGYEKGSIKPSNEVLIQLSKIFECTTDYLVGQADVRNYNFSKFEDPQKANDVKIIESTIVDLEHVMEIVNETVLTQKLESIKDEDLELIKININSCYQNISRILRSST